jgi:hypothetical protein
MAEISSAPRPTQLWKQLDSDLKMRAADAFWRDENADAEQAEAIAMIAQRIKFRLKSVIAMPVEKKARQLLSLPAISEALAARLLVAYHLAHERAMMGQFLDALGIAHEDGLISEETVEAPTPERLASAAKAISTAFPAESVSLYLSTLYWQDPDTWGGISDLPQAKAS